MADNEMKIRVSAVDNATSTLKAAGKSVADLGKNFKKEGDKINDTNKGMEGSLTKVGVSFKSMAVGILGSQAIIAGFHKAWSMLKEAVADTSAYEQNRVAFETMLGSADAARQMLTDLANFAAKTPFELPEVVTAGKQLLAYGIEAGNVIETMKILGDVAAGVGSPVGDLAYLFGTLKAQGQAMMVDMRQFANRGIPIWEEMAKVMGVTVEETRAMVTAGKIGFPQVEQAFINMSSEGGKFYNLMEKQSATFGGVMSNSIDILGQFSRELLGMEKTGDIVKGSFFDKLKEAIQVSLEWFTKHKDGILKSSQIALDVLIQFGSAIAKIMGAVAKVLNVALSGWRQFFSLLAGEQVSFTEVMASAWNEVVSIIGLSVGKVLAFVGWSINQVNALPGVEIDTTGIEIAQMRVAQGTVGLMVNLEQYRAKTDEVSSDINFDFSSMGLSAAGMGGAVEKAGKQAGSSMDDLGKQYDKSKEAISKALEDLEKEHLDKMLKISGSIEDTKKALEDLRKEYDKLVKGEVASFGQEMVDQEAKIADLKDQIATEQGNENPDDKRLNELRQQLAQEEAAYTEASKFLVQTKEEEAAKISAMEQQLATFRAQLEMETDQMRRANIEAQTMRLQEQIDFSRTVEGDLAGLQMQLSTSVADARNMAGKTELERFLINWQNKWTLEKKAFDDKNEKLKAELAALEEQKAKEKEQYDASKKHILHVQNEITLAHERAMKYQTAVTANEIGAQMAYYDRLQQKASQALQMLKDIEQARKAASIGLGFAEGGIVPAYANGGLAQRFSGGGKVRGAGAGDIIDAKVSPGELILNLAQQKNLVAALGGGGGMTVLVQGNQFYGSEETFAEKIGNSILKKVKDSTSVVP